MTFGFFTISTFDLIPMCNRLSSAILDADGNNRVEIHECTLSGNAEYDETIRFRPIGSYKSRDHFKTQSVFFKIFKSLRLLFRLSIFHIKNRRSVTYTIDLISLNCLLLLKKLFFFNKTVVIYHQFEMLEIPELTAFQRFNFSLFKKLKKSLDLFICPEQNRIDYFCEHSGLDKSKSYLLPNTCYPVETNRLNGIPGKGKITIVHIGNVGQDHFITQYLGFLKAIADPEKYRLLFVGHMPPDVVQLIHSFDIPGLEVIGAVPHQKLQDYYDMSDIGFILYRDLGLNFRYCAPNKLYEYWANGIPVIAPNLPGLEPLFKNEFQGLLVDMDHPETFINRVGAYINAFRETNPAGQLIDYFKKEFDLSEHEKLLLQTVASKQSF